MRVLPPSLLFAAGAELLLDDSVRMHEKLEQAGCESRLIVSPGLWHAYVLYGLREYSRRDTATMTAFLRAHLRQKEKTRWMRLDNAAKIFPASRRKNWANLFRLSVELSEEIDPLVLQAALDATVKRFPSIAVRLKGGHDLNDANDLLYRDGTSTWFRGRRIDNPNTHGTGCTLSSAIASNLACGMDLEDAVRSAKAYISGALAAMLNLGKGRGPMNHLFDLKSSFIREVE